jgi:hypothetical protein
MFSASTLNQLEGLVGGFAQLLQVAGSTRVSWQSRGDGIKIIKETHDAVTHVGLQVAKLETYSPA